VLLAGFALGCRGTSSGREHAATVGSGASSKGVDASGAATVLVESPRHDFGQVTEGDTLRHTFVAQNLANEALVLDDTPKVLGCGVTVPGPLEPGRDGKVEVTCEATVPGPLQVSLPLRVSGRPVGELSISAKVEPLLAFAPSRFHLALGFGEKRNLEIRLQGKQATAARLSLVGVPPPGVEVRVLPRSSDERAGVEIRAVGEIAGTHAGSMRFSTGLERPPEVSLGYTLKVESTLAVSPTNPVVDLYAPGPKRAVLRVTSTQPGFSISRAEILEGPFTASVRRVKGGFEVEIGVVEEKLSPRMSGVNGRLLITSNDRTEGKKEVPLLAIGKVKPLPP
jgi:hypothetical protein